MAAYVKIPTLTACRHATCIQMLPVYSVDRARHISQTAATVVFKFALDFFDLSFFLFFLFFLFLFFLFIEGTAAAVQLPLPIILTSVVTKNKGRYLRNNVNHHIFREGY